MNIEKIKKQLIDHEGLRLFPYRCTAGKLTIGVGHNLDAKGISEGVAMLLLGNDIAEVIHDLTSEHFQAFYSMPEKIQHVLIDMRFQLGAGGFRKFKKMIAAVDNSDWHEMTIQMAKSTWYRQVPNRAKKLISMVSEVLENI